MGERRRLSGLLAAIVLVAGLPSVAAAQEELALAAPPFSAGEYLSIWDSAALPGLVEPDTEVFDIFVAITGDPDVDARIREMAVARGYERQPVAAVDLVAVDGRLLQAPAAEAWLALKAAARDDGVSLGLTSAFRSVRDQRIVFLDRLAGRSEAAIATTLRFSAPPGFSRHHTGYTIDVGQPGGRRIGFGGTRAYRWLADDDFAVARSLGWIPSYPEGGTHMGPDPEPWELVWVGAGRISCSRAQAGAGFCDIDGSDHAEPIRWLAEVGVTVGCRPGRFCPDDPATRGDIASMLWRLHGAPTPTGRAPFEDVVAGDPFGPAVDWLWSQGLTTGMTPISFGPAEPLRADDALALLLRLSARPELPTPDGLLAGSAPPAATTGGLGAFISRAELATILVGYAAGS